eukprot:547534_1
MLPWSKKELTGIINEGFKYKTEVKKSRIKDAGDGRFTLEFIPKDSIISQKELVSVNSSNIFDHDKMIFMKNVDDLNFLINLYLKKFKDLKRKELLKYLNWFIASRNNKMLYLNTTSECENHSHNENAISIYDNKHMTTYSSKDIYSGQEIVVNYTQYKFPKFYLDFCKENKMIDPKTFAEKLKLSKL